MIHRIERGEKTSFSISSNGRRLPGEYAEERTARYALQFCEHTLAMFADTVNGGEHRLITSVDLRSRGYTRLCHACSLEKAKKAFE